MARNDAFVHLDTSTNNKLFVEFLLCRSVKVLLITLALVLL